MKTKVSIKGTVSRELRNLLLPGGRISRKKLDFFILNSYKSFKTEYIQKPTVDYLYIHRVMI